MTRFAKIALLTYFGIFMFCLGKFTYMDGDGYGFFTPLGGYHVSTLRDS
jgi:hypothetical protein